jgi:hypothetical protein
MIAAASAPPHTQVVMAAIFDLLFSQCDRHGQNLYLKPDGSLVLIDNDQVWGLGVPWESSKALLSQGKGFEAVL